MKIFSLTSKFVTSLFAAVIVFVIAQGASAASLELTNKEKQEYHKQYVEIVEKVVAEHPGTEMEVVPLKDFADEDWVEPEVFRQIAIERANVTFSEIETSEPEIGTLAVSKTKSKTIKSNGVSASINITGSFNTYYSSTNDRQLFSSINSITSKSASSGSWTQTGYTPSKIDGGRTYAITVGGKYTLNGLTSSHNIYVEFYCSATGGVS